MLCGHFFQDVFLGTSYLEEGAPPLHFHGALSLYHQWISPRLINIPICAYPVLCLISNTYLRAWNRVVPANRVPVIVGCCWMSTTGSAISINNLHLHHWHGCTLPHCSKKHGVLPVDVEILPQLWPLPIQVVLSLPFFTLFTLEWIISESNCGFSFSLNRNFSPLEVWLREWGEQE